MARLPYRFWTVYRRFLIETLLDRGESRALIAGKLGVTRRQLQGAITHHDLKPRPLLKRMLPRAADLETGRTCEGCGDDIDGTAPGWPRFCVGCKAELETCEVSRLRLVEPVHG